MSTLGWRKRTCKRGHENPQRNKCGACVPCQKELGLARYKRDPSARVASAVSYAKRHPEARRDQQRAYRLGVSVVDVRTALSRSGGKCEACGKALTHATACIDHCHATGRVRGVLCRFCNALEGMLNKRSERVGQVLAYVELATARLEKGVGA
jgi:hypothetical protein